MLLPASSGGSQCRIARSGVETEAGKPAAALDRKPSPPGVRTTAVGNLPGRSPCLVVNLKNRNILVKALARSMSKPDLAAAAVGRLLACHRPTATNAGGCARVDFCRRGVNQQVFSLFKGTAMRGFVERIGSVEDFSAAWRRADRVRETTSNASAATATLRRAVTVLELGTVSAGCADSTRASLP